MSKRRYFALTAVLSLACLALTGVLCPREALSQPAETRNSHLRKLTDNKIAIRIGEKAFIVTLYDNPAAKDLISQLPLTLKANNYPGYDEKVIRLPNPLSMKGGASWRRSRDS
jgi:hypothetical protein